MNLFYSLMLKIWFLCYESYIGFDNKALGCGLGGADTSKSLVKIVLLMPIVGIILAALFRIHRPFYIIPEKYFPTQRSIKIDGARKQPHKIMHSYSDREN